MKVIGCILFSILCSLSGFAQSPVSAESKKPQYYVGLRLNNTAYYFHFNQEPYNADFAALPIIHIGYYLTKKSAFQIGLAYGGNFIIYTGTKALILPITYRYTMNPTKRFQFFGSASVVPAYGSISREMIKRIDQVTTTTYQAKANGFNTFITGTLGINYQISKRWEGNAEFIFFNKNVKDIAGLRSLKAIGFGVNYKL